MGNNPGETNFLVSGHCLLIIQNIPGLVIRVLISDSGKNYRGLYQLNLPEIQQTA
jgi:hypothetical protein